jgi:hypothetical protein
VIGIDQDTLQPVRLDFSADPHFLVASCRLPGPS